MIYWLKTRKTKAKWKAPFWRGNSLFRIAVTIPGLVNSQGKKLFTPGDDAYDNDYGKNSRRDQVALYIHVVKKGV